jgi:hypothetical protein
LLDDGADDGITKHAVLALDVSLVQRIQELMGDWKGGPYHLDAAPVSNSHLLVYIRTISERSALR